MTVAAIDRLIHHATIIQFPANIESRRKKEHNKTREQVATLPDSADSSTGTSGDN
jgi:hypothetical protein